MREFLIVVDAESATWRKVKAVDAMTARREWHDANPGLTMEWMHELVQPIEANNYDAYHRIADAVWQLLRSPNCTPERDDALLNALQPVFKAHEKELNLWVPKWVPRAVVLKEFHCYEDVQGKHVCVQSIHEDRAWAINGDHYSPTTGQMWQGNLMPHSFRKSLAVEVERTEHCLSFEEAVTYHIKHHMRNLAMRTAADDNAQFRTWVKSFATQTDHVLYHYARLLLKQWQRDAVTVGIE